MPDEDEGATRAKQGAAAAGSLGAVAGGVTWSGDDVLGLTGPSRAVDVGDAHLGDEIGMGRDVVIETADPDELVVDADVEVALDLDTDLDTDLDADVESDDLDGDGDLDHDPFAEHDPLAEDDDDFGGDSSGDEDAGSFDDLDDLDGDTDLDSVSL